MDGFNTQTHAKLGKRLTVFVRQILDQAFKFRTRNTAQTFVQLEQKTPNRPGKLTVTQTGQHFKPCFDMGIDEILQTCSNTFAGRTVKELAVDHMDLRRQNRVTFFQHANLRTAPNDIELPIHREFIVFIGFKLFDALGDFACQRATCGTGNCLAFESSIGFISDETESFKTADKFTFDLYFTIRSDGRHEFRLVLETFQ